LGVFWIEGPIERVVANILSHLVKFVLVPEDAFIIVTLPE
jgi:hypothetical protein